MNIETTRHNKYKEWMTAEFLNKPDNIIQLKTEMLYKTNKKVLLKQPHSLRPV
jgi:hypothetical protein